jgi:hypothetical protein
MELYKRHEAIIKQSIAALNLNLSGLVVLTEVASGLYIYTPIIALLAGAKKVVAVVNDSKYGLAKDIKEDCLRLLSLLQCNTANIEFSLNTISEAHLAEADIITNSGHLRPLDKAKLAKLKPQAVLPLMYEKWELRDTDIDIQYCNERNIRFAGTWENHPALQIFDYCKHLMLKLIFEAGFEIKGNSIIIFSDDHYGKLLEKACIDLDAKKVFKSTDYDAIINNLQDVDFIFFCDYNNKSNLISDDTNSLFPLQKIKDINPNVGFVHLVGQIDSAYCTAHGFTIYPNKTGYAQRMTETLAYLGPNPILKLQTAGLKVGEELYHNELSSLSQL